METVNPTPRRITLACDNGRPLHVPLIGRGTTYAYDCVKRVPVIVSAAQPMTCTFATGTRVVSARSVGVVTTFAFDPSGKHLISGVPAVNVRDSGVADAESSKAEGDIAHPLVARCLRREQEAWRELLEIYEVVGARSVQLLVLRAGFDECEADDIAIEIFLRLLEGDFARLRSFRGSSDPELQAWLGKLAHNFAIDYLDRRIRGRRRERQARKKLTVPDRSGPTEQVVAASVDDLKPIAPPRDMNRMRFVSGLATLMYDISARTHRRWVADLYEEYWKPL